MQGFIISLLNTDFAMALVIGAFVTFIVKWLASAQGLRWKKWEGLAITAVKMAEIAIPNDVPNRGAKRLDTALRIFLEKYEAAAGVEPNQQDVAEITSLISVIHDQLESAGNLPLPKETGFARIGTMLAMLAACTLMFLLSGCAVIHGGAGESRYTGFALGEKASSTLAGLNITETKTEKGKIVTERGVGVDQSGVTGEADIGKMLGNLLLLGLQSQGVPVKASSAAPDVSGEADGATVLDTAPVASEPLSVISGEGVPVVAILGNRATCKRCTTLWGKIDPAELSESLCGASIIDADKTDNASEYARLRPKGSFAYPLVRVYAADGKLAGEFGANGMTQAALAGKVRELAPECVPK